MTKKLAAIDLGTNTFHLMIIEADSRDLKAAKVIYRNAIPSRIGQGGINKGVILPDAIERAVGVLKIFNEVVLSHDIQPKEVFVMGTSAIRNASNQAEFIERIKTETGFEIKVITGEEEAELIYLGNKAAVELGAETAMMMDIGGGSVEFIICNANKVFWKQSFEIGGQRLMELFMKNDPISSNAVNRMNDYFNEKLVPLANACHQYAPVRLIGSSGSFDTLAEMYSQQARGEGLPANHVSSDYPMEEFYWAYDQLLSKNRAERMAIPGMIELRVDMIVVAMCLIRYVLQQFQIRQISVSSYSLKEGVLSRLLDKKV
jgi:exopolyphosphatase / guanosine-5'-triphosphate,3'-diphosphate pyrophosphatase